MKVNQIKIFAIGIITFSLFAVIVFNSAIIQSVSTNKKDVAATYKTQCAACHSPKAEKAFDPAKADEALVAVGHFLAADFETEREDGRIPQFHIGLVQIKDILGGTGLAGVRLRLGPPSLHV